jgi:hypothetical protein
MDAITQLTNEIELLKAELAEIKERLVAVEVKL